MATDDAVWSAHVVPASIAVGNHVTWGEPHVTHMPAGPRAVDQERISVRGRGLVGDRERAGQEVVEDEDCRVDGEKKKKTRRWI